jgi:hypothetical protein
MHNVFIAPDIIGGIVESQDFVLIDTITSANDTDPAASTVAVNRRKVRAYQRPYAR